ncbi:MAG TPA: hypothetical protein VHT70_04260 [Candidatus Saccharimonadales bacterium]|jgi:hypothetical protein|nr:hypothetical protein [Candidatus Saccharimonadales bacterium]
MAKKTPAAKQKTIKKAPAQQTASSSETARKLKPGRYHSFRLEKKRLKPVLPAIPSAFTLFANSLGVIKKHWKVLFGIVLIYGILNLILVRGLSDTSGLTDLKSTLNQVGGHPGKITTGFTLFTYLLSSSGASGNSNASIYQTILIIVVSLALIWTLRQIYANQPVRLRDGYYRGMTPLIPFLLVLMVIGAQLLPMLLGGTIYNLVVNNGIAIYTVERLVMLILFLGLAVLSIYMVCSSIFALYIVTLPDMTPMRALRSARQLVQHRRWTVIRKIIFLPIVLIIAAGVIMLPLVVVATSAAAWIFFVLTMFGMLIIHSYMYALYRSLV